METPADVLMLSVSGLRGTFGGSLTPEVIARYAVAFASYLRSRAASTGKPRKGRPQVVVACDGRVGAEAVKGITISALNLAGCDTGDLGVAATPTVGLVVDFLGSDGALQITASHNPQQWCGLKTIIRSPKAKKGLPNASAPDKTTANEIATIYRDGPGKGQPWDKIGTNYLLTDLDVSHAMHVLKVFNTLGINKQIKKQKYKVIIDDVCATGKMLAPSTLNELNCKVERLYQQADGIFPHPPEPTQTNLTALCKRVRKQRAHLGLAQDPDADRLALVDDTGTYIGEEYTLVLSAMALAELGMLKKGSVVPVNLSTSRMIEDVATTHGFHVVRTPVGEANVVAAMKANKSPLGGEGNGGVIWPQITYIRDSLGAMALVLALMAHRKQTLSAIVKQIPPYAIIKRKIDLTPAIKPADVLDKVAAKWAHNKPDRADGVWVPFHAERAWMHVRASNTEPIIRLIAEAPTPEQAEGLLEEAAKLIG
ncbi:MAG: phosphoglucosamine mutase [bacterium]